MKKTIRILAMILVICLAAGAGALAADGYTRELIANYVGVKLVVDGVGITPKDANGNVVEPFIVDGTTYLPVRAVAEALGKPVDWDGETKTVYIGQKPQIDVPKQTNVPQSYNTVTAYDGTTIKYTAAPFLFVSEKYSTKQVIDSLIIESTEKNYSNDYRCQYTVTGTVTGNEYMRIDYRCYDNDGILLKTNYIWVKISEGEKFRDTDTFIAPAGTVLIEFSDHYSN